MSHQFHLQYHQSNNYHFKSSLKIITRNHHSNSSLEIITWNHHSNSSLEIITRIHYSKSSQILTRNHRSNSSLQILFEFITRKHHIIKCHYPKFWLQHKHLLAFLSSIISTASSIKLVQSWKVFLPSGIHSKLLRSFQVPLHLSTAYKLTRTLKCFFHQNKPTLQTSLE